MILINEVLFTKAWAVFNLAKEVWNVDAMEDAAIDAKAKHQASMVFPIGQPNDAFAQYFIGQSYLAPVSTSQVGVFNVTFEPGCSKLACPSRKRGRRTDSGLCSRTRLLSGMGRRSR